VWRDGVVDGESVQEVGERADAVLDRVRPLLADGDVALVGHGHALRVLAARWLGLAADAGRLFALDTATLSVLGHERERAVLKRWNVSSAAPD
jgi:probable phosphoglycerate mutase